MVSRKYRQFKTSVRWKVLHSEPYTDRLYSARV